jgi:methylated-DNA-[protein]-cysteine S-methyltransferase
MTPVGYLSVPSRFGPLTLVWREERGSPRLLRVVLPNEQVAALFPEACPLSCAEMVRLGEQVQRFLAGEAVTFDLGVAALEGCSPFQRRVLLAEYGVPRGRVTTYGRLARLLGVPDGARAVGGALAHNPFPIIIPCHRAVRSDGRLGGFRGGLLMKRALLEQEGVSFTAGGRVAVTEFHYG